MKLTYGICLGVLFIIVLTGCEKEETQDSIILYNIDNGLPNQCIRGLAEDNNGNIWISTDEGIALLNQEGIRIIIDSIGSFDRIVTGPDNSIWFGHEFSRELSYRYDWNNFERISSFQELYASMEANERYYYSWYHIYHFHDNFWVTTPDYCSTGAYKYNGAQWSDFNTRQIFQNEVGNSLYGIVESDAGEILISAGSHIIKYEDDQWSIFCDLNLLAKDRLLLTLDLFADSKNNIWFPIMDYGTFEGLLYSFDGNDYELFDLSVFPYSEEQEIRAVTCIIEDSIGNVWVGTTDGLFKIYR